MTDSISKKHPELWKFIKFNITVVLTSALDILTYLLLLYFVFAEYNSTELKENALLSLLGIRYKGYLYSYLISTTVGYVAAYIINRKITFRSDVSVAYSSVMYFILAVFNILVSSYIGGVFGSFIASNELSNPLVEIVSKFIIINIPTLWTYPLERYVIQIKRKPKTQKIIATDLDGTLLKSDTTVSSENLCAIKRLSKKGIKTVVLTGRTFYEIPYELRSCDEIEYFVYSNGAGIQSSKKGIIYYNTFDRKTSCEIYEILDSFDTLIELYSNQFPYIDEEDYSDDSFEYYRIDESFLPEMKKSRKPIKNLKGLLTDESYKIEMFDVFFRNDSEKEACRKLLLEKFDGIEITSSLSSNLEIIKKGTNKGFGLKKLCELTKYDLDDIIVIGDSKNDISAFNTAKTKYAVSNACDEIKSLADKIICSNDEDIMKYMENEI